MSIAQFEQIALIVCVGGLILLMLFIVYDMAKKSGAGKWGMAVMFFALGLGILGFVAKSVLQVFLEH